MRLAIYRQLDKRVEFFGLSLPELFMASGILLSVSTLFSFWSYGRLLGLGSAILFSVAINYLNTRYEKSIFEKIIRFISYPDTLEPKFINFQNQKESHASR